MNRAVTTYGVSLPYKYSAVIAPYTIDLDTRSSGIIYYRETFDSQTLSRATQDIYIFNNRSSTFKARQVVVISYINVPGYSNRYSQHTFQVVLASDGNTTYSILNYERLDVSGAVTGFSEGTCNFRTFISSKSSSRNLAKTSNAGRTGRHIYKLTKDDCFKQEFGIKFFNGLLYTKSQVGRLSFSSSFSVVSTAVFDLITGNLTSSLFISRILHTSNLFLSATEFSIAYIMYATPSYNHYVRYQGMAVLKGTSNGIEFQHGVISLPVFASQTVCTSQSFSSVMARVPSVKLTGEIGQFRNNYYYLYYVNIWLRNVTTRGFTFCYKEMYAFSGTRNISVHYVAVAGMIHNVTEHGKVMFSKTNNALCVRQPFKFLYLTDALVFVTPAEEEQEGELIAWVKNVAKSYFEVCAKNSEDNIMKRDVNMKVHFIVQGQVSPCSFHTCPSHLQCQLTSLIQPYCGCIRSCSTASIGKTNTMKGEFCGTDSMTYKSVCELHKSYCDRYGNNSKTSVTLAHYGKCQSMYYFSSLFLTRKMLI